MLFNVDKLLLLGLELLYVVFYLSPSYTSHPHHALPHTLGWLLHVLCPSCPFIRSTYLVTDRNPHPQSQTHTLKKEEH
jgi:hypothetical protein